MQVWAIDILGGLMYSDELSDVLRMNLLPTVKFRQFCDAKDATSKGLHKGDKWHWNVYSEVLTGGGVLDEQVEMPEDNFNVRQAELTIREYGNSVPYSGKLDNLSKQPVTEIIHKVLKVDAQRVLDGAAHAQFDATLVTVAPTSGNSATAVTVETTGCTITNAIALNKDHIKAISDVMKERNIPPYVNDDYYAIAWPTTFRTFKNNLEALKFYVETGFKLIMNGEIGRYEGFRFVEQTAVAKGGAVDSTTWTYRTADPWNGGVSDWCFFFGEDTVAEAIAIPEEMRGNIPTDYGRSRGVAWYYLGGFGLAQGTTSNTVANARIIKWESAA